MSPAVTMRFRAEFASPVAGLARLQALVDDLPADGAAKVQALIDNSMALKSVTETSRDGLVRVVIFPSWHLTEALFEFGVARSDIRALRGAFLGDFDGANEPEIVMPPRGRTGG